MLDQIPPEILHQITSILIHTTLSPPTSLLLTCRTVHDAISPETNPLIYALVFGAYFDTAAVVRREKRGLGGTSREEGREEEEGEGEIEGEKVEDEEEEGQRGTREDVEMDVDEVVEETQFEATSQGTERGERLSDTLSSELRERIAEKKKRIASQLSKRRQVAVDDRIAADRDSWAGTQSTEVGDTNLPKGRDEDVEMNLDKGVGSSTRVGQRTPAHAHGHEQENRDQSAGRISPRRIVAELRKRVRGLARMKTMVEKGDVTLITEDDLWLVYLMLLEDDGKNWAHFARPIDHSFGVSSSSGSAMTSPAAVDLIRLLRLYRTQVSLAAALGSGFVDETPSTSLAVWIEWLALCKSGYDWAANDEEAQSELVFVLRPFVFFPQKYDVALVKWTANVVPDDLGPERQRRTRRAGAGEGGRRAAGRGVLLALDGDGGVGWDDNGRWAEDEGDTRVDSYSPRPRTPSTVNHFGQSLDLAYPVLSHAAMLRFFQRAGTDPNSPDIGASAFSPSTSSRGSISHDRDFARLIRCARPLASRGTGGMRARDWRGCWDGSWEGTFSFLEFTSFRDMLLGDERAVFEGPYVLQAQVWKITETFIRPRDRRTGQWIQPFTGPMSQAGFTHLPDLDITLNSPSAEVRAQEETIKRQVEACPGFEAIPNTELERELEEDKEGIEMLITGTGHSAWGRFIVRGRVRIWDGMAVIIKEYTPNLRGRWVYRGYLSTDNTYVGRWRDSITAEDLIGYEGTFILTRR